MPLVYLETSFISACVSERTDAASIYRRDVSREWWDTEAARHRLAISAEVIVELRSPRYPRSGAAMDFIRGLPLLDIDERVIGVAELMVRERLMPAPVAGDALHVGICVVHGADFLLTWNVRHLANQNKLTHLRVICQRLGLVPPTIVTPDLLWDGPRGDTP